MEGPQAANAAEWLAMSKAFEQLRRRVEALEAIEDDRQRMVREVLANRKQRAK